MRVLVVHPGVDFSVADVWAGWVEAFEQAGCDVHSFNLNARLAFYSNAGRLDTDQQFVHFFEADEAVALAAKGLHSTMLEWLPDLVVVISCLYLPLDTLDLLRARGAQVVIVCTEEPYEADRELLRAGHADLNVLNDPTFLAEFQLVAPTMYLPAAYRPTVHHPAPADVDMASDFCFVGTGFPSRVAFLEAVDWTGIDVALGGMWQTLDDDSPLRKFVGHDIEACMDNTETTRAYQSAKTSANLYRTEADRPELVAGWACGPREIELAATGTFFARQSRPESDALFPMLPVFSSPQDLGDIVRWALAHPEQRQLASTQARAAASDRSFTNNARALLLGLESTTKQGVTR